MSGEILTIRSINQTYLNLQDKCIYVGYWLVSVEPREYFIRSFGKFGDPIRNYSHSVGLLKL